MRATAAETACATQSAPAAKRVERRDLGVEQPFSSRLKRLSDPRSRLRKRNTATLMRPARRKG
jgi:hypothetical protein